MLAAAIVLAALVQPGAADMMHRPRPTPPWDSVTADTTQDGRWGAGAAVAEVVAAAVAARAADCAPVRELRTRAAIHALVSSTSCDAGRCEASS
jgi:hypothetical protein